MKVKRTEKIGKWECCVEAEFNTALPYDNEYADRLFLSDNAKKNPDFSIKTEASQDGSGLDVSE